MIFASSTEYLSIPVTGPAADLTGFPVSVALIPDSTAYAEPQVSDYKTASWLNGEVTHLVTSGDYPAGQYLAYVRVQAAPEDVRLFAGRVRIGDARV